MTFELFISPGRDNQISHLRRKETPQPAHALDFTYLIGHALFESDTNFWWPSEMRRKICGGSYLETAWDIIGLPKPYRFDSPLFFPTDEERERAQKTKSEIGGQYIAWTLTGSRPDKVARLILDSPVALGISAEAAAEQQVKGEQAALDAFSAQCVAVNCALGPDPKGAITALLTAARSGKGPRTMK